MSFLRHCDFLLSYLQEGLFGAAIACHKDWTYVSIFTFEGTWRMKQEYNGCKKLQSVPRVKTNEINATNFFEDYISTRTPILLEGFLSDPEWKVSKESWSIDNLINRTPKDMKVKIEYRDNDSNRFGLGKEKKVTFHQFLKEMKNGATNFYMTTQELEYDLEDHPEIISSPLTALKEDFPLIPKLFGNLIVSNINLWMGKSSTWTTSGLHHDYHDNLYIMLKGQKQITLISPAYAEDLYTVGEIDIVYSNGRINYVGQPTFADGRSLEADKAWSAAQKLKCALSNMKEVRGSGGKRFGHKREGKDNVSASESSDVEDDKEDEEEGDDEDELDRALEAVLDAEHDDYGEESNYGDDDDDDDVADDDFALQDDYEDSDLPEDGEEDKNDENSGDEDEEDELPSNGKRSLPHTDPPRDIKKRKVQEEPTTTSTRPDNFSQVDTSLPMKQLKAQFPRYAIAAKAAITVTLREGEMLFIPAGWFHEVKSQGSEGHVAFNYWFHPPDQLNNFEKPYSSDFWPSVYASKLENK